MYAIRSYYDLSHKNYLAVAAVLAYSYISVFAIITCLLFGWDTGGYYYIIMLIPLVNYCYFARTKAKIFAFLGIAVIYYFAYFLSHKIPPYFEISKTIKIGLFVFNSFECLVTLFISIFIYSKLSVKTYTKSYNFV